MPYRLIKSGNGYFVGLKSGKKMANGRKYLSNKPMTRDQAKRQLLAVQLREQGRKIQNPKSLKKKKEDGFMRIDPKFTKKKKCPKGYDDCHCDVKKKMFKKGNISEQLGSIF